MLLTFGNAVQPEGAFEAAVAWVSGNALGITIVLVMHGVLWPHTGERQFDALLRHGPARQRATAHAQGQQTRSKDNHHRRKLAVLRAVLSRRCRSCGWRCGSPGATPAQLAALRPDYDLLIEHVQALVSLVITLGESLRICRQSHAVTTAIEQSGSGSGPRGDVGDRGPGAGR